MAPSALLHRDLDLVDRVLAPTTESDDVHGRLRLVGRRDHDPATRELDLEGDAPGSVKRRHRTALAVVAARRRAADADSCGARALGAHAIARVEKDGVVERE
jgi:hypothetical protein